MESLVFLQSLDNTHLTKIFNKKNKIENPKTKFFSWHKLEFKNLKDLKNILNEAVDNTTFSLVLGRPKDTSKLEITRESEYFKSGKSHILILDVDNPKCGFSEYLEKVPNEFLGKKCIVAYTARHQLKPDIFKFRLFYWLDTAVTLGQQKKLAEYFVGVDCGIYQPGRFIYTAKPLGKFAPKIEKRVFYKKGENVDVKSLLKNTLSNKIRKAAVHIQNVDEGERNNEYYKIVCGFAKTAKKQITEEQIQNLKNAAIDNGLSKKEVEATWRSAWKRGKVDEDNEENVYDTLARIVVEEKKYNVWETSEGLVVLQNPMNGTACELTEKDSLVRDFINKEHYELWGQTPTRATNIRIVDALRRFKDYNEKNIKMYKTICYLDDKLLLVKLGRSYYVISDEDWNLVEVEDLPCVFASNNEYWDIELEQYQENKSLLKILQDATEFNNLERSEWIKIFLFILGCFNPSQIYNVLMLQGSEGSGKSTIAEMINFLLEAHDHLGFSNNSPNMDKSNFTDWARYIGETCNKWHIVSFDNVSHIDQNQSDLICKLVVQKGIEYKKLYVQKSGIVEEAHPVIINSINDIMANSDLRSRTIFVDVENADKMLNKERLIKRIREIKKKFLSLLFDVISVGLENYEGLKWSTNDRSGVVSWACACARYPLLGISAAEFKKVFKEADTTQKQEFIENNFFMGLLIKWLKGENIIHWEGTSTELKENIEKKFIVEISQSKRLWPDNIRSFGRAIARCSKTAKDYLGINMKRAKNKTGARIWRIKVDQIEFYKKILKQEKKEKRDVE